MSPLHFCSGLSASNAGKNSHEEDRNTDSIGVTGRDDRLPDLSMGVDQAVEDCGRDQRLIGQGEDGAVEVLPDGFFNASVDRRSHAFGPAGILNNDER